MRCTYSYAGESDFCFYDSRVSGPAAVRIRLTWLLHQGQAPHQQPQQPLKAVKDDHAFLWEHAIFRYPPSRNP